MAEELQDRDEEALILEAHGGELPPPKRHRADDGRAELTIEPAAKTVRLETGEHFPYDHLIIATGAKPRRLHIPGADLDGVLTLRSAADAEALKAHLGPGKRIAVVGGVLYRPRGGGLGPLSRRGS